MIGTKWVQMGLAACGLAATFACALAVGCGTSSSSAPGADAAAEAKSSDSGSGSSSGSSGGGNGPASDAAPNANLYLVNAVVDPAAPVALRFCFGINISGDGGTVAVIGGVNAFPDGKTAATAPVAGLLAGFGGSVNSSPQLQSFNFATIAFIVYALNAQNPTVAGNTAAGGPDGSAELPCEYLIGSDGLGATTTGSPLPYKGVLTEGKDYWPIASIAQNELATGTSWLAAATGCVPGEEAGALCGSSYSNTAGNLALTLLQLDNTTQPDGGVGAQLAQVSPAWDAVVAGLGGATTAAGLYVPGVPTVAEGGIDAGDASAASPIPPTFVPVESTAVFGDLLPKSLATVPGVTFDGGSGFFAEAFSSAGAPIQGPPQDGGPCVVGSSCVSPFLLPLPAINALTLGPDASSEFVDGAGYAFVLLGDPTTSPGLTAAGGPCLDVDNTTCFFNGRFVHFLAFPTK